MKLLIVGGSVLLIISLALAWLLVFTRILNVQGVKRLFPSTDNLLKAHIDYLLMALLLYAFYAIADELPVALIVLMLAGGTVNPFLFLVLATKKDPAAKPGALFSLVAMASFIAATIGFGGAAIAVLLAAYA